MLNNGCITGCLLNVFYMESSIISIQATDMTLIKSVLSKEMGFNYISLTTFTLSLF